MAPTFLKAPPLFRSRSAGRDARTDLERLAPVRSALATAAESAARERGGLQQRFDAYCMQAASLMDNSPDYPERSPQEEDAIAEAERHLAAVRRRIGQLDAQISKLRGALAEFEASEASEA